MATKYRVTNGNWDDANSWAESSGGVDYTTTPTSSDDVIFDANTPSGTHAVNVAAFAKSIDFTGGGASNFTGTFAGGAELQIHSGDITLSSSMTYSHSGILRVGSVEGSSINLNTNGVFITSNFRVSTCLFQLQSNLKINNKLACGYIGSFISNNYDIECTDLENGYTTTRTIDFGTSEITCTSVTIVTTGLTFLASNSIINCSGNFSGGGKTYGIVNLTSTSTISGNNTFSELNLNSATAKTKTLTAGSTQTGKVTAHGSTGKKITINSSTPGSPAYLVDAAGSNNLQYVDLTDIQVSGGADWTYDFNSTYNTGNSGWRANPFEFNFSDFEWNTESVFA